jgi:FkbM family methyltransferase
MLDLVKKILPISVKSWLSKAIRTNYETKSIIKDLEVKIAELQTQIKLTNEKEFLPLTINHWHETIVCENAVNLALRDLCKPGSVVFDVGAHDGSLSLLMSRLVGPKGLVCAFEANSQILDQCTQNLVRNGCNNVSIIHRCVWRNSHESLKLYQSVHPGAASLYYFDPEFMPYVIVPTIALDDFINVTNLNPSVIKMDIEGAEFDALQGIEEYISKCQPHFILEQHAEDGSCIDFLRDKSYLAIDLNNYKFLRSNKEYPEKTHIRNVLFIRHIVLI